MHQLFVELLKAPVETHRFFSVPVDLVFAWVACLSSDQDPVPLGQQVTCGFPRKLPHFGEIGQMDFLNELACAAPGVALSLAGGQTQLLCWNDAAPLHLLQGTLSSQFSALGSQRRFRICKVKDDSLQAWSSSMLLPVFIFEPATNYGKCQKSLEPPLFTEIIYIHNIKTGAYAGNFVTSATPEKVKFWFAGWVLWSKPNFKCQDAVVFAQQALRRWLSFSNSFISFQNNMTYGYNSKSQVEASKASHEASWVLDVWI